MPDTTHRPLKVFLCHAHEDKATVRDLYRQLSAEGWMDIWLDEEKLLPGQEWDIEIEKAVEAADIVLVCLSSHSVDKEGYIQKEMRFVLNIAEEKPEGTIFVVPLKLEDCEVPRRLRAWQWVDYFPKDRRAWAYQRLLESLKLRAARLGISTVNVAEEKARLEAEERARKEAEENARKEREERERKAITGQAESIAEKMQPPKNGEPRREAPASAGLPGEKAGRREKGGKIKRVWLRWVGGIVIIGTVIGICVAFYSNLPAEKKFLNSNLPHGGAAPAITTSYEISSKDGMTMILIPAGDFEMGSDSGDSDEQPVHTVYLDDYWFDQTEVTNRMYALCVASEACNQPDLSESRTRQNYYYNPDYYDYPVVHVSWDDATAYCAWADRRLPTEAEWEKAARGTDGRIYPWGNSSPGCSSANYTSNCVGDTIAVGSYPSGASPYGALDMAGNVWEWVSDWYSDTYYASSPDRNPAGPASGEYRVQRGGSWGYYGGTLRSANRDGGYPEDTGNYFGFRCARSTDISTSTGPSGSDAGPGTSGFEIAPWTRPADYMVMVYVPKGEFTMGSNDGGPNEQPIHTVFLDAYWIDQTEVTNRMYALCVAAGKCDPLNTSYYGKQVYDDSPVIYVTWNDASAYCAWAGGRLPTEAEWEKAARGTDGRTYPWGEGIDCQKANYRGCVGDISRVGSYENGKSPYGAYDMAGNAFEWVADWYDAGYYNTLQDSVRNPTGPSSGEHHLLRGGYYFSSDYTLRSSYRYEFDPTAYTYGGIGFRCARTP